MLEFVSQLPGRTEAEAGGGGEGGANEGVLPGQATCRLIPSYCLKVPNFKRLDSRFKTPRQHTQKRKGMVWYEPTAMLEWIQYDP